MSAISPALPRLRRLEDIGGSSAGWWEVRDLPGVILARQGEWFFYPYPPGTRTRSAARDLDHAQRLLRRYRLDVQRFPTRRQALQALQGVLLLERAQRDSVSV